MDDSNADAGLLRRFDLACEIAKEGGRLALGYYRDRSRLTISEKTSGQDVVSIADREVETLLRKRIAERFPDDGILGEEFGMEEGSSGFTWVMDPIDGTTPFVFGIPAWCVSIAIMQGDTIVVGAIYAPVNDELYSAMLGHGARMNGETLAVQTEGTIRTGVVGVGANHRIASDVVPRFLERLLDAKGMFIRNGSGALMLAYVASGRLAAYWEPHMNAWDCFAGILLIEEAGGWAMNPNEWSDLEAGGLVLAGAPKTKDDLLTLLATP